MRALILVGLLLSARVAHADNRAEAAKEFAAGQAADEAKDYKNAIDHYFRAYELSPHHFPLYNIAVAHEHLGAFREAAKWYQRYLDEAPTSLKKERRDVEKLLVQLKARPAKITVRTTPTGARVLIDGQVIGPAPLVRPVRGGGHRVRVELDGERNERDIVVEYGEPQTIEMTLGAARTSTPAGASGDAAPTQISPPSASATTGTLAVTGTPVGALITIDKQIVGRVPAEIPVEPGAHAIAITLYGYTAMETTVDIATGAATPLEVALPTATVPPTMTIRAGYVLGAGGGADASGTGAAAMFDVGVRVLVYDLGLRIGKLMDLTAIDVQARWALFPTRVTPFLQVGVGYGYGKDASGAALTPSTGLSVGGGLRVDVARGALAALSLVGEAGLRYYPSLDEMDGKRSRFGIPILVSAQVLYGKLR